MTEKKFEINNEDEFNKFIYKLEKEGKLTKEEADAMSLYVCGLFDALSAYAIEEEDLI